MTSVGRIELRKGHLLDSGGSFGFSSLLQEQMCYLGQQLVFEESSQTLERLLGITVTAKQIERICHYYGEEIEKQTERVIITGGVAPERNDGKRYYAMFDGSLILTREEKWKEMKLARIFDEKQITSTSKNRNLIGESTYVAHLGNYRKFFQKVECHLDNKAEIIFIADGAKWIWKTVESFYPESVQILDFYHAKEHLCQWAELVFKDKTEKKNWVNAQCLWMLNDKIESVIKNIRDIKVSAPKKRSAQKALIEYYTTNLHRMKYRTFRSQGLLIGSGPIEAAHKNVIQQRLKLCGQRWTKQGAQQIANLRATNKSNQWHKVVELIKKAA